MDLKPKFLPEHQLVDLVGGSLRGGHPVARVDELPRPGVGHALVGRPSLGEYLPAQDAIAPDVTEGSVLAIVQGFWRGPLDRDLFETV